MNSQGDNTYRYFLEISYDGTDFYGWQKQPKGRTVQGVIEETMSTILRHEVQIVGAGRTDSGVHGRRMVAHTDIAVLYTQDELVALAEKFNRLLPSDIVILTMYQVPNDLHARFSALSRCYHYYINLERDPFNKRYETFLYQQPNFDLMNEAASLLIGTQDFTTFSKKHTDVKTHICTVTKASWYQINETKWFFEIEADRFLRNMVRATVGTLLAVGRGKITVAEFKDRLIAKDRSLSESSAMAEGLFLEKVTYPLEKETILVEH